MSNLLAVKQSDTNLYRIIHHYDVWGNAVDGYEVNDSTYRGYIRLLDATPDSSNYDNHVIENMKLKGFCAFDAKELEIDYSDGHMIFINLKAGYPLYTLELIEFRL